MKSKESSSQNFIATPIFVSSITVALVVVLVCAKSAAYFYSGSAAVLSSLIDSLCDTGLSLMTLFAIYHSHKPADANHRHGHGKIEGVSALLQSAVLLGGASFLAFEGISRLLNPQLITDHIFTLMLMGFSVLISLLMVFFQRYALNQTQSLALEADYAHYSSDIFINLATIAVVLFDYMKIMPVWLDTVSALLVGVIMGRAAYKIARQAIHVLMDTELSPEVRSKIFSIITKNNQVMGVHDLRSFSSGKKIFVSFDMEVDPNILLWSAHEIARSVEHNLIEEFPNAEILIHLDPAGDTEDTRHFGQKVQVNP